MLPQQGESEEKLRQVRFGMSPLLITALELSQLVFKMTTIPLGLIKNHHIIKQATYVLLFLRENKGEEAQDLNFENQ